MRFGEFSEVAERRNFSMNQLHDEAQSRGKSGGSGGCGRGYLNGDSCGYGGGCGGRREGGVYGGEGFGGGAVDTAVEVVYKEMVDMEMKDVSGYNGGGDGYSFLLKTFYLWSQDAYLGLLNFIDNFTTTFAKREGRGYRGGGRGGGGGGYRNGDCGCYGEIGGGYEGGRREGKDNGS
ncbi:hypothetical protein F2Q70_00001387 [Brassica cretica]|uniref:Uncharacterized protein n=1 Tax=Brassica cretica TaxID=69181 RepID=A0A8S9IZH7_BRACR|nr:hypothetical protein F2Q70_00001387 [Brassica cretica]